MVSSLIEASAPLKKPVAADKAMAASERLQGHVPRRIQNQRARRRWGTVIFMLTIHALTIFTLQAQFWSWLAFSGFIFLYWVTACLGVTTGYHRLLSHRSFQVPKWLERFFATCGALSCQHEYDCSPSSSGPLVMNPSWYMSLELFRCSHRFICSNWFF